MFEPGNKGDIREEARRQRNQRNSIYSLKTDVSIVPGSISGQSTEEHTVTISCATDDELNITSPSQQAGIITEAWATGKNTALVRFTNITGGSLTPTSGTYKIRVMR